MKIEATLKNGKKRIIYGNKFCNTGVDVIKLLDLKIGYFKWGTFNIISL